tara:strand:- start:441 stop:1679 length:1239 start_codon:yes stop_codon:yes gene_type:complete
MGSKEFDIVIFGATSFVGQILSRYFVNDCNEPDLKWALAGRSQNKLRELKSDLGHQANAVPIFVADSFDEIALKNLCARTSLVISTVGPYALYGDTLLRVCAQSGTDYCDLTGEPHWIRRMMSSYEEDAKRSGARIVNSCGFDSIPSDLGVKFLQNKAFEKFGTRCDKVRLRVKGIRGSASGGTIASGVNTFQQAAKDHELRRELKDPYSLCPQGHRNMVRQDEINVVYDKEFKSWVGPFVMAAINTRIVLRSNAISNSPYAEQFRYDEGWLTGDGGKGQKRAKRLLRYLRAATVLISITPIRVFFTRFVLPRPGDGPSLDEQISGFYDFRLLGRTSHGDEIRVKVMGDRDPGYGSTAKMLGQAGISLVKDISKESVPGGFWTPATVFNDEFIERLRTNAGMSFEVLSTIRG